MGDSSGDWTLITVTYNSARQLDACWSRAVYGGARWIVVDNASQDGSADVAERLGAEVVRLSSNMGFGTANNVALRDVRSEWTAFVNPDVVVASAHGLERLAAVSRANDAVVAPQLLNPNGSEQPNARGIPYLADKVAHRLGARSAHRVSDYARTGLASPTFCAWTVGAAVGGPTRVFQDLGGWDEDFFVYYEDHDLGLRAWAAGHPVVVDPGVRWIHQWQRETTRLRLSPWRHEWNGGRTFYRKHPALLRRRGSRADGSYGQLSSRLWRQALNPA